MVLGDYFARSATVAELHNRKTCLRTFFLYQHYHGTFTEIYTIKLLFSQQSIIQGFQVIIRGQSGGMQTASYRAQEQCNCYHQSFEWYATPVVNLLP
jgi:hypothetical protein